ncbi:DUF4835 family protein [Parafilimonas sp.]|uniref:type IX secretion system protein PorD n=1 Tax=Parafilimonas sp. TaxID=1969739 RepID=UPI0039E4878E
MRKFLLIIPMFAACAGINAQELQAKVVVLAQQVGTTVDKSVFTTLQNQLAGFINSRKWTQDAYQPQEKINCNFILTVKSVNADNVYNASLAIQAARPVFNATYQTALINYQDADVQFKYVQYEQLNFNENRVQGTDALSANLTAIFAYYAYMILGFDYDSFSLKGGDAYFMKAQNIVTNAPEAKGISGWKPFDGQRNRYWLSENMVNTRYNNVHDIIYGYYRNGLDKMYSDAESGRTAVLASLSSLQDFNQQNPNTMIAQFLVQGKSQEYIGIFRNADPQSRTEASQVLASIDISNAGVYKESMK